MMRENLEVKPLLFINNTSETSPVTKMQSTFTSKLKFTNNINKQNQLMNDNNQLTTEKIDFLSKFPKEIPSVKCEIKTNKNVYVGRIMKERDHMLEIALFGRPPEMIDKREIEEINIIGF